MMRIAVALLVALAVLAQPAPSQRAASACGTGPVQFEAAVRDADFILIGRTTAVGDNTNRFPTPAPPSPPSPRTPTVVPRPTFVPPDIAGVGATIEVERVMLGAVAPSVSIDEERRLEAERQVRVEQEQDALGITSPCGAGFAVIRYEPDRRYLVVSSPRMWPFGSMAWPVDGEYVLFPGFPNPEILSSSFESFFTRFEGQANALDEGGVILSDGRVPLEDMTLFVESLVRGEAIITPPITGSAGLRSGR